MKETSLPFVIESAEVDRLQKESGLSLEDFLATLVEPTRALARPPISKFHVGAVGLGSSGRVFRGVNVEFSGLPLNFSIHAEQFLVANAARNGEHRLQFLAVSAAPCGHCRQFLQELRGAGELRVLIADEKSETQPLSYFLPHRFGPSDLLEDDFPLLLETQSNNLHLLPPVEALAVSKSLALRSAAPGTSLSPSDGELTGYSEQRDLDSPEQEVNGLIPADASKYGEDVKSSDSPSHGELIGHLEERDLDSPEQEVNGLTPADASKDDQDLKSASFPNLVAGHLTNSQFSPKVGSAGDQGLDSQQLHEHQNAALESHQFIQLRNAALEAANSSYTPYTNSPSGVAFLTTKGAICQGPYFESAAYNPSLPPLQTAVVAFIAEGGRSFEEISSVVLVEKEGAAVRQAAVIRLALGEVSPEASFHVFEARTS